MLIFQPDAAPIAAAERRCVKLVFILLYTFALIALLKCKREDIPKLIRALAFWWRGWPRSRL